MIALGSYARNTAQRHLSCVQGGWRENPTTLITTQKQRDSLAKFFWDMAKITFTVFLIGPLAKPETISLVGVAVGFTIGFTLTASGYILDGRKDAL